MRIAYVCSDFDVPIHGDGGPAVHVRELSRALERLGHEVAIFSPRQGGDAPAGFDVEVCALGQEGPEQRVFELLSDDPTAGVATAREVRALLYSATLRYRLHGILGAFKPDAIYERYSRLGSGGQTIARGMGIPLVLDVATELSADPEGDVVPGLGRTARSLEKAIVCDADRVVAPSPLEAAKVERIGFAPEHIAILPPGIDVERFAAAAATRNAVRARFGIGVADPVVGFVADLLAGPGPANLIRAVGALSRQRPAPRLLIGGEGPERANLEALVAAEGIAGSTVFAGDVAAAELPGLLAAMDIVTAPDDPSGGVRFSPLPLFAAMAAGRPMVAAATARIEPVLRHGQTGVLYPPGDLAALTGEIAALLGDPARAAALGRAAEADVRGTRIWDANAQAVVELVRQVLPPLAGTSLGGEMFELPWWARAE